MNNSNIKHLLETRDKNNIKTSDEIRYLGKVSISCSHWAPFMMSLMSK